MLDFFLLSLRLCFEAFLYFNNHKAEGFGRALNSGWMRNVENTFFKGHLNLSLQLEITPFIKVNPLILRFLSYLKEKGKGKGAIKRKLSLISVGVSIDILSIHCPPSGKKIKDGFSLIKNQGGSAIKFQDKRTIIWWDLWLKNSRLS